MRPARSDRHVARQPAGSDDGSAVVDAGDLNPFPGPRPFAETENGLFFGRDRELSDLIALLFAQRAVLLHGPSGGGKSSLVLAGLIPRARQRGFTFLPVARVRDTTDEVDRAVVGNRYVSNLIENWSAAGLEMPIGATTLVDALSALPEAEEPGRVVVFDQFEELFVLHPESWRDRADLLSQIQAALDRDPLLHVVFILRDDFLARLQPLAPLLRDRLSTRYHLQGLSSAQALDAVVRPFAATGRRFEQGVAEHLVAALRAQPADVPGSDSYEGEDVEPVQLQIVCRTFFERLPPDVVGIAADDVEHHADVGQALVGFYEQALAAAIKGRPRAHERKVRLWFERQLITPARTRGIVFRDERTTAGLQNEIVDELERRRVVRSEPRGPALWYELTHDRLIDAVLGSNRIWYASRARTVTRASAALGALVGVAAVLAFVLLIRGGGGSGGATTPAPPKFKIEVAGQTRSFDIDGRAGQLLTAVMTPGDRFAGVLRLTDDGGVPVGRPTMADSTRPVLAVTLPADGHYRIEASGRENSTGSFGLTFGLQTVDTRSNLAAGKPTPGAITAPDMADVYTFTGRAGALAEVTMTGDQLLYNRLVVVGPAGQVYFDEDASGYNDAFVAAVLPQDGAYEVRASSARRAKGSYRLDLAFPEDVGIAPGTVTGPLEGKHPHDVRTIRSEVGGDLDTTLATSDGAVLDLRAADGSPLTHVYVGSSERRGEFDWVLAPATTYLLVVTTETRDSRPTPYSLSVGLDESLVLTDGGAQGELRRPKQLVTFRLDDRQGGVVSILVSPAGKFDAVVGVVGPGGATLIRHDGGGPGEDENFTVELRSSGPHLLVVSSATERDTGKFTVSVTQKRAGPPG